MLFEELVEQHCVYRVVTHRIDLPLIVAHYQVWVHLGYFLGDQAKSSSARIIVLVMECDRFQAQDGFAGLVHWLNVFLETLRGGCRAKFTSVVYYYWCVCSTIYTLPEDLADKAA